MNIAILKGRLGKARVVVIDERRARTRCQCNFVDTAKSPAAFHWLGPHRPEGSTEPATEMDEQPAIVVRKLSPLTHCSRTTNKLGKFLAKDFRRIFGPAHDDLAERLGSLARSTIECLGRSDAPYHNFENTLQVTLVGRDILQGLTLSRRIEPADYSHLIVACLLHDIGYMRGVLSGDTETEFVLDRNGKKVTLPRGASDAALTPYHVDRSKLFALERLGNSPTVDPARVAEAIEFTRFPPRPDRNSANDDMEPRLVQAADLIGQLGDPMYSRKANALYFEFEEIGMNRQLGYSSPADLIDKYPAFFWNGVSMHLNGE